MNSSLIIEYFSFIVGLFCFRSISPKYLRWIVLLLGITVLNESFIVPYIHIPKVYNRDTSYNIFSFFDMITWYYVFFRMLRASPAKKWIPVIAGLVVGFSVVELTFLGSWKTLHTNSLRVYSLTIILLSIYYLYRLLCEKYHNLILDPLFYICCACLIYQGLLFLNLTTEADLTYWKLKYAIRFFHELQITSNIFYYLLLCVAFFVCYYRDRMSKLPMFRR